MLEPFPNAAYHPAQFSAPAPPFSGVLHIRQSSLTTKPDIEYPLHAGRDARLFPGVSLEFFTVEQQLVPVQRGQMVAERGTGSYWQVIPQIGRIWRDQPDGWSTAAFPLNLVADCENQAHQGLARFLYRDREVRDLVVQFVQHTAPYLLGRDFDAWGALEAELEPTDGSRAVTDRPAFERELALRLPARRVEGRNDRRWQVITASVRDGTLCYQDSQTDFGPYPYPLEMRFGVRSIMKAVGAPLTLLRLAQVYGPQVLGLRIGEYVPGLQHSKWNGIRFMDVANMASGFGGVGSLATHPNDCYSGYLDGNYIDWYLAPSHAQKLLQINSNLSPYPWEPGRVMRYRDQDFYLLGAALQGFLHRERGPDADPWDMLRTEVFEPIGIPHAPALRTREPSGRGLILFNAGYYPTLDDLAKIALLYQHRGQHGGEQILHRQLTADLLAGRNSISKGGGATRGGRYQMGFHFMPNPMMWGSGDSEVVFHPDGLVSIVVSRRAAQSTL